MYINCVFLHILRYSSENRPSPYYVSLYFIFMHLPLELIVESYKKSENFKLWKRYKMIFSLVFLLKIGKLHFYDYLRNKAPSPTFNFAFCNLHEQTSNTYKKIKNSKTLTLRGTSLLKGDLNLDVDLLRNWYCYDLKLNIDLTTSIFESSGLDCSRLHLTWTQITWYLCSNYLNVHINHCLKLVWIKLSPLVLYRAINCKPIMYRQPSCLKVTLLF